MAVLRFVWNSKRGIPRGFFSLPVSHSQLEVGVGGMCSLKVSAWLMLRVPTRTNMDAWSKPRGLEGAPTLHSCGKWSQQLSTCFIPYKAIPRGKFPVTQDPGPKGTQSSSTERDILSTGLPWRKYEWSGLRAIKPRFPKI